MRTARIIGPEGSFYHCFSRIIQRQMFLNRSERERARKILRAVEAFSGVNVITYALLTNHIHGLFHVPPRQEISDEELFERVGYLYDKEHVMELRRRMKMFRDEGLDGPAEELKASYTYRMYDLAQFMKVINDNGELSRGELLRCSVRYFVDGAVLGIKEFVEEVFQKNRDRFGYKRQTGARRMKGGGWGELFTMRDLRLAPITVHTPG
jgi:REP element-mobilizing transposase RayT